jgi:hypothetical protein
MSPTLNLMAIYQRWERNFVGLEFVPGVQLANDFDRDGIPDTFKDYTQQSADARLTKRLSRQVHGSAQVGHTWRESDLRAFGAKDYSTWTWAFTVDSLLSRRTRIQFQADRVLTDTVREFTIIDLNAFTNDQLGQFTVLPEQFSAVYDERFALDLVQNVFRRGDQVLVGVAYQRDHLVDQIGSQNFFIPGTPFLRPECQGQSFCETVLRNERQRRFLVTGAYRVRMPGKFRFMGIQARGTWFRGEAETEFTDAFERLEGQIPPFARQAPRVIDTNYWSFGAGLVINLQVLD